MASYIYWQKQIGYQGSQSTDTIGEAVVDLSPFGCAKIVAYISAISNAQLLLQTAPSDDPTLWSDVGSVTISSTGKTAVFLKATNPTANNMERLLRWKIHPTATSWSITFSLHLLGYQNAL